MKGINKIPLSLSALLLITLASVFAASGFSPNSSVTDSKYRVFCANSKIEVEQRTLEQQKNARGSSVCMLAGFDTSQMLKSTPRDKVAKALIANVHRANDHAPPLIEKPFSKVKSVGEFQSRFAILGWN